MSLHTFFYNGKEIVDTMSIEEFVERYNKRSLPFGDIEINGTSVLFSKRNGLLRNDHPYNIEDIDSSWKDPSLRMSLEDCVKDGNIMLMTKWLRAYRRIMGQDDCLTSCHETVKYNLECWKAEVLGQIATIEENMI
jgi:hypothetical protein